MPPSIPPPPTADRARTPPAAAAALDTTRAAFVQVADPNSLGADGLPLLLRRVRELGEGAQAKAVLVEQRDTGEEYCVKHIRVGTSASAAAAALQEVQILHKPRLTHSLRVRVVLAVAGSSGLKVRNGSGLQPFKAHTMSSFPQVKP